MRRWGWVSGLAVVGVVIFLGCSPTSDSGNGPVIDIEPTDPDNLLDFLAQAYENQDLEDYDRALDVSYLFEFTPAIAESLDLPEDEPWWGKTEDMTSTGKMFAEPTVTEIKMDYIYVVDWYVCDLKGTGDSGQDTVFTGWCARLEPDIKVTIEQEVEPLILWVNNSYLDITVVPNRHDEGFWSVLMIEEEEKQPGG